MATRDDERGVVVQALRSLAGEHMGGRDGVPIQELLFVLGVLDGSGEDLAEPSGVYRLARWIDRPACRNVADPCDGSIFECSECGEVWELTCGGPEDNHLNFCPMCGAEVVDGDD